MAHLIEVNVRCPNCHRSLSHSTVKIDERPAIHMTATVNDRSGDLYLSSVYGSYNKMFSGVPDIENSIVQCGCPHCDTPFPTARTCDCQAPVAYVDLELGGVVNFCTRNGCKHHSIEFENMDDAFNLFRNQDETDWS